MTAALAESLVQAAQENPWIAPAVAFAGGLLTAANPCVIAMVPLMIGFVGGQKAEDGRHVARAFQLSLTFTVGLTSMFAVLFLATWAASSVLQAEWWTYVAGSICLLMGLHLLGLLQFQIPALAGFQPHRRGFLGALLLGLLFGLVSLPCAGPVLITLLAVIPLYGVAFGAVLLVSYSVGHCGLILAGGTSMGMVQRMIDSRGWDRGLRLLRSAAGVLIIGVGVFVLYVV